MYKISTLHIFITQHRIKWIFENIDLVRICIEFQNYIKITIINAIQSQQQIVVIAFVVNRTKFKRQRFYINLTFSNKFENFMCQNLKYVKINNTTHEFVKCFYNHLELA